MSDKIDPRKYTVHPNVPYGDPGAPRDYRDYLRPAPVPPRPDRALATTFLRGQFAEHQQDTAEQWTAWRDSLPFRWAQALVDEWRAEQEQP